MEFLRERVSERMVQRGEHREESVAGRDSVPFPRGRFGRRVSVAGLPVRARSQAQLRSAGRREWLWTSIRISLHRHRSAFEFRRDARARTADEQNRAGGDHEPDGENCRKRAHASLQNVEDRDRECLACQAVGLSMVGVCAADADFDSIKRGRIEG